LLNKTQIERLCAATQLFSGGQQQVFREHQQQLKTTTLRFSSGDNTQLVSKFLSTQRSLILLLPVISGFRREVDDMCALLGHYAENGGNLLPTFRDNLSVPPSRVIT